MSATRRSVSGMGGAPCCCADGDGGGRLGGVSYVVIGTPCGCVTLCHTLCHSSRRGATLHRCEPPPVVGRRPSGAADDRQELLLDTVERLLADRSFRDLTVADVMAEAALPRTTFYRYFPDLESILLLGVARVSEELGDASTLLAHRRHRPGRVAPAVRRGAHRRVPGPRPPAAGVRRSRRHRTRGARRAWQAAIGGLRRPGHHSDRGASWPRDGTDSEPPPGDRRPHSSG